MGEAERLVREQEGKRPDGKNGGQPRGHRRIDQGGTATGGPREQFLQVERRLSQELASPPPLRY